MNANLFILAVHDMEAGRAAHDPVVLIHDRIGVVTRSHHLAPDVLRQFIGVELDDLGCHDLADRRREIGISGSVHGTVSGKDQGTAVFFGKGF